MRRQKNYKTPAQRVAEEDQNRKEIQAYIPTSAAFRSGSRGLERTTPSFYPITTSPYPNPPPHTARQLDVAGGGGSPRRRRQLGEEHKWEEEALRAKKQAEWDRRQEEAAERKEENLKRVMESAAASNNRVDSFREEGRSRSSSAMRRQRKGGVSQSPVPMIRSGSATSRRSNSPAFRSVTPRFEVHRDQNNNTLNGRNTGGGGSDSSSSPQSRGTLSQQSSVRPLVIGDSTRTSRLPGHALTLRETKRSSLAIGGALHGGGIPVPLNKVQVWS